MRKLVAIVALVLFFFCSKKDSKYPRIILPERKNVIQVNTKTMLHIMTESPDHIFVNNFTSDTVIGKKIRKSENELFNIKWDSIYPRYDFKIIIDTSYTVAANGILYKNLDFMLSGHLDFEKVFALWEDYVECYPLLIYNNGKVNAYSPTVKLIQEAKDTDGKWKPIEFFVNGPSCTSTFDGKKYLPKTYAAMTIIKYNGDFKTKLRAKVKIGKFVYYSNEITGQINRSQFDEARARKVLPLLGQFRILNPLPEEFVTHAFLKDTD